MVSFQVIKMEEYLSGLASQMVSLKVSLVASLAYLLGQGQVDLEDPLDTKPAPFDLHYIRLDAINVKLVLHYDVVASKVNPSVDTPKA